MTTLAYDVLCPSHLRWDFTFQRPQHLMSRFARHTRVFYIEEPVITSDARVRLDISERTEGIRVAVPLLPEGLLEEEAVLALKVLVDDMLSEYEIADYILWYYTPMALPFTRHLRARAVAYDCMDELSAFKNAPPQLVSRERELMSRADVVFTGGQSLFEAKQHLHANIHPFPSSIDVAHFGLGRTGLPEPEDQAAIPRPRVGYCGVIDERMNVDLVAAVADMRPDLHFVFVGPVVKIDPEALPKRENIHYLGGKGYDELPAYVGGWDVAMMPFALNESTRYISPTKTPEYLAAGRPVVSSSIRDVVRPYKELGLVSIADTPEEFAAACDAELATADRAEWLSRVDEFLARNSWDRTWARMRELVDAVVERRQGEDEKAAGAAPLYHSAAASELIAEVE